jgi:hypothetical protein
MWSHLIISHSRFGTTDLLHQIAGGFLIPLFVSSTVARVCPPGSLVKPAAASGLTGLTSLPEISDAALPVASYLPHLGLHHLGVNKRYDVLL